MGKTQLDKNSQPSIGINFSNNETKAVNTLYGIIMGVTADNKITDEEIHFLNLWLSDNDSYTHAFPLNAVKRRVKDILSDGIITQGERDDFQQLLSSIIGGTFQETGTASGLSTGYKIEYPDHLVFEGAKFCLTGGFVTGARNKCEQLIIGLGGTPVDSVTSKLDYLVVGALASRDWIASSHGRKIEKALYYQEQGHPVKILSEETWAKFINVVKKTPYSDLPPLRSLGLEELTEIAVNFVPPRSGYGLPRIAFLGRFRYLSMSDQRYICKHLGFEYIEDIAFATTNEDQMAKLTSKWREIADYTRLVVIGDAYDDSIFKNLYRRYKSRNGSPEREPIIIEKSIPVMMESELIKIHPDYPDITTQTSWINLS